MSNDGPLIREATIADASGLAAVQVTAWKTAYRSMIPQSALDALTVEARTERWAEIIATNPRSTLVATVSREIVGWSGFGKSRDADRPESAAAIYGHYVSPDHWRTGVGSELWSAACDMLSAAGYSSVDVWVLEANDRARRFYESVGCTLDTASRKMFDGDGYSVPEVRYRHSLVS